MLQEARELLLCGLGAHAYSEHLLARLAQSGVCSACVGLNLHELSFGDGCTIPLVRSDAPARAKLSAHGALLVACLQCGALMRGGGGLAVHELATRALELLTPLLGELDRRSQLCSQLCIPTINHLLPP